MTRHNVMDLEDDLLDAAVMMAGVTRSASPSRDPAIAWALMELHGIDVFHTRGGGVQASVGDKAWVAEGPTQLIAVMRAFVMHRLGNRSSYPHGNDRARRSAKPRSRKGPPACDLGA